MFFLFYDLKFEKRKSNRILRWKYPGNFPGIFTGILPAISRDFTYVKIAKPQNLESFLTHLPSLKVHHSTNASTRNPS